MKKPINTDDFINLPKPMKNPAAVALGREGGKAKSQAKTLAARANILKRWAKKKAKP